MDIKQSTNESSDLAESSNDETAGKRAQDTGREHHGSSSHRNVLLFLEINRTVDPTVALLACAKSAGTLHPTSIIPAMRRPQWRRLPAAQRAIVMRLAGGEGIETVGSHPLIQRPRPLQALRQACGLSTAQSGPSHPYTHKQNPTVLLVKNGNVELELRSSKRVTQTPLSEQPYRQFESGSGTS